VNAIDRLPASMLPRALSMLRSQLGERGEAGAFCLPELANHADQADDGTIRR